MKKLDLIRMIEITGGKGCGAGGSITTGILCAATLGLLGTGIFAPLAGATGAGCLIGAAAGCAS